MIGGVFNLIGILFISSCTGLIGYLLITRIAQFETKLNSPVLPTFVINFLILGYGMHWIYYGSYQHGNLWNVWRCFNALLFT